jgi:ATP-dependent RNA helicase DeaD
MSNTFRNLGLNTHLLETLETLGYAEPTPIQAHAIPLLLDGHDVVGQAQTGTGKTAAYTLPIMQQLNSDDLQVLILTPTRELAIQVSEAVYRYGHKVGVRVLPVYGGQSYDRQERRLKKGVQVVVGTPGRTKDLIEKGTLKLQNIRFVVLDEADEMLKMGFIDDVEAILSATDALTRQTILFSATFTNPIRKIAQRYMRDAIHIEIESEDVTSEHIEQRYFMVQERDKLAALCRILEVEERDNTLIFTKTRVGAAELAEKLAERNYGAIAIHGDLAQNERERILNRFRTGQLSILVATDVVGRGVDITDISHVINYDLPPLAIEYVHRIGRTGRAGRSGNAISLITPQQRYTLRKIETYIEKPIAKTKLPTREDAIRSRDERFSAKIIAQIAATTEPDSLLDELEKSGFSVEQILSGMIQMLREQEKHYELEHIKSVQEQPERKSRRPGRGRDKQNSSRDNANSRDNGSSNRKGGRRKEKGRREEGMVRLHIDVGRTNGIRPGDVVYSVASHANIPGHVIGAIDIRQNETYVDLPEIHVEAALKDGKKARIRGHSMNLVKA